MNATGEWPFEISIKVIFRDLDAMGHVNNAVYFTYMETARTTFFGESLELSGPKELPVIVAEATCTYLSPLVMGDTLWLSMGVSRIGQRSFDLAYLMRAGDGRQVARAKTIMVTYDYAVREAIPIPDTLKTILQSTRSPESGA